MPDPKTYILDDLPTDKDALDFTPYVETLVDVCKTASTPLTIGVFGTWGAGKTSLMKMVQKGLQKEDFTIAWFDAWKYDKEDSLWRAFLLSILTALKDTAIRKSQPTEEFEKLETLLYREMEFEKIGGVTIDLAKLGGSITKGVAQLSLSFIPGISTLTKLIQELQGAAASSAADEALGAIQRERTKIHIEQVKFLEQFQNKFRPLVTHHITNNGRRLVVFVDDLDRCLPEKAIEVLEAIKLFVDAPGCIFILGLDQDVIARGIEMKYRELGEKKDREGKASFTIEGLRYLEKIIQLPFQIPPVEQTDMGEFVKGLIADWPHEECPKVFAVGLGNNPRQIKRAVNVFLMLWNLSQKRTKRLRGIIKPIRLAKIVVIQTIFPELYTLLRQTPQYIQSLEEYYREYLPGVIDSLNETLESLSDDILRLAIEKDESTTEVSGAIRATITSEQKLPPSIIHLASRVTLYHTLTMHPEEMQDANFIDIESDEIRLYFTLTQSAELAEEMEAKVKAEATAEEALARAEALAAEARARSDELARELRERGE